MELFPSWLSGIGLSAVTETRIHVFSAELWRVGSPRRLLRSLPPGAVIKAEACFYYEIVDLAGERLWVLPALSGPPRRGDRRISDDERNGMNTPRAYGGLPVRSDCLRWTWRVVVSVPASTPPPGEQCSGEARDEAQEHLVA